MPPPLRHGTPEDLIVRSLAIAGTLSILKIAAGAVDGSLGILASALDSLMDLGSSAVNLATRRLACLPPDAEHPYGRGKAESLAGLLQGALIFAAGLFLVKEAWRRFEAGRTIELGFTGVIVMLISAAASLWHSRSLKEAAARETSAVLEAEKAHFATDFLANVSVAAALAVSALTNHGGWDLGLAAVISILVLREAALLVLRSSRELTDRSLPLDALREIDAMIRGHDPRVVGAHNLRARRSGPRIFIDFHIEIRGIESFSEAHELTESLIDRIKRRIPNADVTVHYDPEGAR